RSQFMVCGVLGPQSNAHGPNEILHVPFGKRLTAAVAQTIAAMPTCECSYHGQASGLRAKGECLLDPFHLFLAEGNSPRAGIVLDVKRVGAFRYRKESRMANKKGQRDLPGRSAPSVCHAFQ